MTTTDKCPHCGAAFMFNIEQIGRQYACGTVGDAAFQQSAHCAERTAHAETRKALEEEREANAWKITPAMAEEKIRQLNDDLAKTRGELEMVRAEKNAAQAMEERRRQAQARITDEMEQQARRANEAEAAVTTATRRAEEAEARLTELRSWADGLAVSEHNITDRRQWSAAPGWIPPGCAVYLGPIRARAEKGGAS